MFRLIGVSEEPISIIWQAFKKRFASVCLSRTTMKPTVLLTIILLVIVVPVFAECDRPETLFESKSCMYEEFVNLDNKVDISYKAALKSFSIQTENKQNLKTRHIF